MFSAEGNDRFRIDSDASDERAQICAEIDERVHAFLNRPIEGVWPFLWIDATYVKVRQAGRIVSVAVIIAFAVDIDGRRELLGLEVGSV